MRGGRGKVIETNMSQGWNGGGCIFKSDPRAAFPMSIWFSCAQYFAHCHPPIKELGERVQLWGSWACTRVSGNARKDREQDWKRRKFLRFPTLSPPNLPGEDRAIRFAIHLASFARTATASFASGVWNGESAMSAKLNKTTPGLPILQRERLGAVFN